MPQPIAHWRTTCFGLVAATLLASSASAAVFTPLPPESALTLGSGVDIVQPQQAVPSCFNFKVVKRDVDGTQRYDVHVRAVNSVEEVQSERRRSGSVSGSYGAVSASLSAWANELRSNKRAGLFVILEARYIGPRSMAEDLTPSAAVANLLTDGKLEDIVRRCGTHVATIEHRAQTLRVVLNLSDIEQSSKQEIAVKFGAKARFGLGSGKASGSYKSTITRLATEKNLDLAMEGTGTAPAIQKVFDLFKAKAGDLNAVADALAALVASAAPGNEGSFVTYGFTLQPIGLFTKQVPASIDAESTTAQLEQLQDMYAMLGEQAAEINKQLISLGYSAAEVQQLKTEAQKYRTLQAGIRKDVADCRWEVEGSDKSCEAAVWKWRGAVTTSRGVDAKVVADEKSKELALELRSRYAAAGTLVAVVNGVEVPLDAFKTFPGQTRIVLRRAFGNPPQEYTDTPLTLGMIGAVLGVEDHPEKDLIQKVQIGCFGAAGYFASPPGFYTPFAPPAFQTRIGSGAATVSPDSVCAGMPPPPPGFGGVTPLMNLGMPPLELDRPRGPITLKLQLVDTYGFVTEHIVMPDVAQVLKSGL